MTITTHPDLRHPELDQIVEFAPMGLAPADSATLPASVGPSLEIEETGPAADAKPTVLDRSLRPVNPTVSVVIPTLNEARNLPYAMWRLPDCVTEVIVVDGRSSDDTAMTAVLMRPDVRVVMEPKKGKGAA